MSSSTIVLGCTFIIMIALLMCVVNFSIITITAVGGLIASGLWITHTFKLGIEERPYEFLAAFAWFMFSLVAFMYM